MSQFSRAHFYPVIVAGGRGTRFWPLSRQKRAKQLLALAGRRTMIQQTLARLRPLAPGRNFWVIANHDLRPPTLRQLRGLASSQVIAEPAGRNTAPAIGLAAFLLLRHDPEAVIGMFPADHVIADEARFRRTVERASEIAAAGENIVVMGIRPTRPETGYGYIETGARRRGSLRVRRFTEKPDLARARRFLAAGNYYWNSGMFVWSARTLADALRQHLPRTARILEEIATDWGTRRFPSTLARLYPRCQSISVDYAVLEPRSTRGEGRSGIHCLPADFGWNDLGSWAALYEHLAAKSKPVDGNVVAAGGSLMLDAAGNFLHAPGKFVAAVGVNDLVLVETEDALLITTRQRAQDVGRVVQHLDAKKMKKLI